MEYEIIRICVTAYLQHIRSIPDAMHEIEDDIAKIRGKILPQAARVSGMPHGSSQTDLAEIMHELEEKRAEYVACLRDWLGEFNECKMLCNPTHRNRFVLFMKEVTHPELGWETLALMFKRNPQRYSAFCYEPETLRKMARKGREELYWEMPEKWRREPIPDAIEK